MEKKSSPSTYHLWVKFRLINSPVWSNLISYYVSSEPPDVSSIVFSGREAPRLCRVGGCHLRTVPYNTSSSAINSGSSTVAYMNRTPNKPTTRATKKGCLRPARSAITPLKNDPLAKARF